MSLDNVRSLLGNDYIILIIIDIYLVMSLVHYGFKTGKWNGYPQSRSSEIFNTCSIYSTLIFYSIFFFIYHILVVVYSTIDYNEDKSAIYKVLNNLRRCFYAVTIAGVSIF